MKQFHDPAQAHALALAIVDTLPEPFLVLDDSFRLLAGSRCFYEIFGDDPTTAHGCSLFDLSSGQWNVPGLKQLLHGVVADQANVLNFEFERESPTFGKRTLNLSALPLRDDKLSSPMVLVSIKDITDRRVAEHEKQLLLEHTEELLDQQKTLLREMQHRIANSLQIIASILLMKAGAVTSEETKEELRAAHQRVMSVAAVQNHLHASDGIEQIEIGPYLTKLSSGIASSMIDPRQPIEIVVTADAGALPSSQAVSIGLIVTELIINSVKYAFPVTRVAASIQIIFEMARSDWRLTVSDNGLGRRETKEVSGSSGLGTAIVAALAKQLKAQVSETSSQSGMAVSVTKATFETRLPAAA